MSVQVGQPLMKRREEAMRGGGAERERGRELRRRSGVERGGEEVRGGIGLGEKRRGEERRRSGEERDRERREEKRR